MLLGFTKPKMREYPKSRADLIREHSQAHYITYGNGPYRRGDGDAWAFTRHAVEMMVRKFGR